MDRKNYPNIKRLYECYMADPGFLEDFRVDASACLEKVRISMNPAQAEELLKDMPSQSWSVNPFLKLHRSYSDWVLEMTKQKTSEQMFAWPDLYRHCQTVHDRMFLQVPFLEGHLAVRYYPIIFELSDGCSVQCPFCGLAAEKWRSNFSYKDPEHRSMWRQILSDSLEVIGPIVLNAACYYATEPFDNPDYLLFLRDFREILGDYPQTTTAIAEKKPDKIRELMRQMGEDGLKKALIRFSIRTKSQFYRIMEMYSPQELEYVELLMNNPESRTAYSASGRMFHRRFSKNHMLANYSISCIAGCVVNLARGTISFSEPEVPSEEFPNGVRIIETRGFSDAREFRTQLCRLLDLYVRGSIRDPGLDRLQLTEGVRVIKEDTDLLLAGPAKGVRIKANLALTKALDMITGQATTLESIGNRLFLDQYGRNRLQSQFNVLFQNGYIRCIPPAGEGIN